jgi:8-oxo-dGTP pyrophosphatase MutT (NUDIX family)
VAHDYEIRRSQGMFEGKIIRVRTDHVAMPGGNESQRDVVIHPGAVGVVALDDQGRVMLIKQYRHPVRESLWELPAGLMDIDGELALTTAQRELGEEAGLQAEKWNVLVDVLTSPGMTDEATRIYLARDVSETGKERSDEDEEADLELAWVDLDEAVLSVMSGGIRNALAVAGLLAAAHARDRNFENLRDEQAPWPDRFRRVPQQLDTHGIETPPQA